MTPPSRVPRPVASGFRVTVGVLLAVAAAAALVFAAGALVPLVLGLFLALALDPVVRVLMRRGLARQWAIVVVAAAFGILLAALVGFVVPAIVRQFAEAARVAPEVVADIRSSDAALAIEGALDIDLSDLVDSALTSVSDVSSFLAVIREVVIPRQGARTAPPG